MTATTTIPGITERAHRCWVIVDPATGEPYPAEEISHYDDFSEVTCRIADDMDVRPDAQPKELDAPCWTVTPECGERFESDGMILHYPSAQPAWRDARNCGWTVKDGKLHCEDCGEACGL